MRTPTTKNYLVITVMFEYVKTAVYQERNLITILKIIKKRQTLGWKTHTIYQKSPFQNCQARRLQK